MEGEIPAAAASAASVGPGRGVGHFAAVRQLANRLVGILHACLKNGCVYHEAKAWAHRSSTRPGMLSEG